MHKHQIEREIESLELENERQWDMIEELSQGEFKRNTILSKLDYIIKQNKQIMGTLADIQAQNAALVAAVADEDTVIDSAVTLITGFAAQLADIQKQLADAIAANDPAALQAVADSMASTVSDISAKKQALANAVAAGTPAAPAP